MVQGLDWYIHTKVKQVKEKANQWQRVNKYLIFANDFPYHSAHYARKFSIMKKSTKPNSIKNIAIWRVHLNSAIKFAIYD